MATAATSSSTIPLGFALLLNYVSGCDVTLRRPAPDQLCTSTEEYIDISDSYDNPTRVITLNMTIVI